MAIGQWQLSERSSLCRYVALLTGAQDVRGTSVLRRPKRSVDRFPLVTPRMGMPSGEVAMVQWTMFSNDRSGA